MTDNADVAIFEKISVSEYLPILDKIKLDMCLLLEMKPLSEYTMTTMKFDTTPLIETSASEIKSSFNPSTIIQLNSCTQTESLEIDNLESYLRAEKMDSGNSTLDLSTILESFTQTDMLSVPCSSCCSRLQRTDDDGIDSSMSTMEASISRDTERLQKIIEEKDRKIAEQVESIADIAAQIESMELLLTQKETFIDKNGKVLEEKNVLIDSMQNEFDLKESDYKDRLRKNDQDIGTLQQQVQDSTDKYEALKRDEKDKMKTIRTLETKVENMTETIDTKSEHVIRLEKEVKELSRMKDDVKSKTETIIDLEAQIKQLKSEEYKLDDNYQQMANNLKGKRAEIREKDNEISSLKEEIEDMEDSFKKVEKENKNLVKRINVLIGEQSECEQRIEESERQVKDLRKQLREACKKGANVEETSKYTKEIEELKRAQKVVKNERDALRSEVGDLQKTKEITDKKLRERDTDINNKNKELERVKRDLDVQLQTVLEQKANIEKKQGAIENMKKKLKEYQDKQKNESNMEAKVLERKNEVLKAEMEQLEIKLENYLENFEKKCIENENYRKDIAKNKEEIENLKRLKFNASGETIREPKPERGGGRDDQELQHPAWWKKHMV